MRWGGKINPGAPAPLVGQGGVGEVTWQTQMPPHHPLFVRKGFCKKKWQTQAAYPLVAVEPPSPFIKKGFCKKMTKAGGVSFSRSRPPPPPSLF